jgi:hypothetical protein
VYRAVAVTTGSVVSDAALGLVFAAAPPTKDGPTVFVLQVQHCTGGSCRRSLTCACHAAGRHVGLCAEGPMYGLPDRPCSWLATYRVLLLLCVDLVHLVAEAAGPADGAAAAAEAERLLAPVLASLTDARGMRKAV